MEIKKVALICLKDRKLLIVHKKTIDLYISPGGKIEEGESDYECLKREIMEELGCDVYNINYWETYFDKTHDNKDSIELRCYSGNLLGKIELNPMDNIDSCKWIDRNYDKDLKHQKSEDFCGLKVPAGTFKLASLLKHKIIPNLIDRGLM